MEALHARDVIAANKAHVKLTELKWVGCECWMPGVRWLMRSVGGSTNSSALAKSSCLVGAPVSTRQIEENSDLPSSWGGSAHAQKQKRKQAPAGEALLPADLARVRCFIDSLAALAQSSCDNGKSAEHMEELYRRLAEGVVKSTTVHGLIEIVQAAEMQDLATARLHWSNMAKTAWSENKHWLTALKRLMFPAVAK
jgi:hypothetical protein